MRLDAKSAYKNIHTSETRTWSVPGEDPRSEIVNAKHGGARIYGDLTSELRCEPKFRVDPKMNVFTIGSCFARNVEVALMNRKFAVATRINGFRYPHGYLNRYNTYSMLQELSFGIGAMEFPTASIVELPRGFADLTSYGSFASREEVIEYRRDTNQLFSKVLEADLIIVTAGLAEVWFDKQYQHYLNVAPSQASLAEPDRFEFRLLDYKENTDALHRLVALIHELVPNGKILITVSPVPLNATFVNRDILISNTYSKACLRAAVEEIYWSYGFVDYFPSYEMVVLSDPNIVWEADRRHVKESFVDRIMQSFMETYVEK